MDSNDWHAQRNADREEEDTKKDEKQCYTKKATHAKVNYVPIETIIRNQKPCVGVYNGKKKN